MNGLEIGISIALFVIVFAIIGVVIWIAIDTSKIKKETSDIRTQTNRLKEEDTRFKAEDNKLAEESKRLAMIAQQLEKQDKQLSNDNENQNVDIYNLDESTKRLDSSVHSLNKTTDLTQKNVTKVKEEVMSVRDQTLKDMQNMQNSFRTNKLALGDKWSLSAVGDGHANDDWLRFMNKDGKDYYGGVAAGRLWTKQAWVAGGQGINIQNKNGTWTHLPWDGNGENYIRGTTHIDGNINLNGKVSSDGGIEVRRGDPGPMVEKKYGDSPGNRYGLGQFPAGTHRLYTAGEYTPGTVNLSFAEKDGNFRDAVTLRNKDALPSKTDTLEVKGDVKTNKIKLGEKWTLSGVGDRHGNDEWLRVFNKDGTDYWGGVAANKLWGKEILLSGGSILNEKNNILRGQTNTEILKSGQVKLGDKWTLSGVGDKHGNDEWLRLFNKDGTDYWGGLATNKMWTKELHVVNGGGLNAQNKDGRWTHFPWHGDGKNYIRGETIIDGRVYNQEGINVRNKDGRYTHFGYPDGVNYIRGYTKADDTIEANGSLAIKNKDGSYSHFGHHDGVNYLRGKTIADHEFAIRNKDGRYSHFGHPDGNNYVRGKTIYNDHQIIVNKNGSETHFANPDGRNYIRGPTNMDGKIAATQGIDIVNKDGRATHFGYEDGNNYIRGKTIQDGHQIILNKNGTETHFGNPDGNNYIRGKTIVNGDLCINDICINADQLKKLTL